MPAVLSDEPGRASYTNGWAGSHPLGVPLFLVTRRPPDAWPRPGAPFTAVADGVGAAIGDPEVIEDARVTHLRFAVRRRSA